MKTNKENLIDGKWYNILEPDCKDCALKYNHEDNNNCVGYWLGKFKEGLAFDEYWDVQPATKEDLDRLGNEWEEHWDEKLEDNTWYINILNGNICIKYNATTPEQCLGYINKEFNKEIPCTNPSDWRPAKRSELDKFVGSTEWESLGGIYIKDSKVHFNRFIDMYKNTGIWKLEADVEGASEGAEFSNEPKIREFSTGSKRDDDSNKPLVNHLDSYLRLRFGYLLRDGANKYDKGNWRKGQPTEVALESLHRHLAKFEQNLKNNLSQDEDHLSAIIFNVMLIMQNEEREGIKVDEYFKTLK